MWHDIVWLPQAANDVDKIDDWITARAGSEIASAYIDRLYAFTRKLETFPSRGSPRNDISEGLRSVTFERKLLIFYRVDGSDIIITRVIDGARDLKAAFGRYSFLGLDKHGLAD